MKRVGLSAWLAAAIFCAAPALVHAQEQQFGQQSPTNTYVTWGDNTRTNSIDVTYFVGNGTLSATQQNIIRQAAQLWNSTGTYVHLVEVGSSGAANVVFQIASTGSTAVVAITNPIPSAQATLQPGTLNGQPWALFNGPITVTASNLFSGAYGDGTGGTINFLMVALQMTGYALGLGPAATGDNNSVMAQNIPVGPGITAPTANDALALTAVYGAPEPATFALFGVGIAVLGFTRKFRLL